MADAQRFRYKAVTRDGRAVRDEIVADKRVTALRRLEGEGLTVTDLVEVEAAGPRVPAALRRSKPIQTSEKVILLRQIAIMLKAGVDLLEVLETCGAGMRVEIRDQLKDVSARLRRGERLSSALQAGMPSFPPYVYALVELGQATGRLDRVFKDGADQMEFENKVQREIMTSLTYPIFLVCAGFAAVAFLFYEVVPKFALMVGSNRENLDGFSALILGIGEGFRANVVLVLAAGAAIIAAVVVMFQSPGGKSAAGNVARSLPVFSSLLVARERAAWARIMSFSLGNGLGLLEATNLGLTIAPPGKFRRGLEVAVTSLRKGRKVDESFGEHGLLSITDLSLLRAGQRSGALSDMFAFIAEQYEEQFRQSLKRAMALVEPAAIGIVAIAVGAVALGLVAAMSSVYSTVS